MKFYAALFLLSASLVLGNGLNLSEDEADVANNGFDAGFGESSEPEVDHNTAPVESPIPTSFPNQDTTVPSSPVVTTNDNTSFPVDNTNIPADNTSGFPADNTSFPPSSDNVSGSNVPVVDNGEGSDDYGDDASINNIDSAPAGNTDSVNPVVDNGEGSDDYGEDNAVNEADNADVNSNDVNDAAGDAGEQSDDEDGSLSTGTKAAMGVGAVGAAAGIFLWVKRSKRTDGYVQSVRTQISMV